MKRTRCEPFLVVAALAGVCAGCERRPAIAVEDSSGATVTLHGPARRIVSTVPSNTEILYALGLEDRVVGVTKYCKKTCNTAGKTVVGGWVNPDCEKIRSLRPDLIFAIGGLQKSRVAEFRKIAPTYLFEPMTVEETLEGVLETGRLAGRAERAAEIVAGQRAVLARVGSAVGSIPDGERLRVARIFGARKEVLTMGGRYFLSDAIRLAGGVNVFGGVDDGFFHVELDRLAAEDPDVLLVHGEDPEKVRAAFKESPHFSKIRAVTEDGVLVYSCDHICHPNATVGETVEMLARGLYPRLFAGEGEK